MTELSPLEAIEQVKAAIGEVAPDLIDELATVDTTCDLWDVLDLDSMDHQNIMVGIFERTGVEIAEREYPQLRSLDSLAQRIAASAS